MEVDDGPPPFNGVVEDHPEHSKNIEKMNSIDDDDEDEEVSIQLNHQGNQDEDVHHYDTNNRMSSGDDITTMQSFSQFSLNVEEKGDSINSTSTAIEGNEWNGFETKQSEVMTKESVSSISTANIENEEDDDDEWGDFGEAAPAPVEQKNENVDPLNLKNNEDDDEWGAFDQTRPSTDRTGSQSEEITAEQVKLAHQRSLEEWGSFENNGVKNDDDEDDWQAEFTAAPSIPEQKEEINLKILEQMLDDVSFWEDGFDEGEDVETPGFVEQLTVSDIPAIYDSNELSEEFISENEEERRFARLWLSLRVVEEALSLKFEWKTSQNRINQFKSLKIDPNVVRKAGKSAFDTSSVLLPTPIGASTSTASSFSDSKLSTAEASKSASSTESPSVPVVDFDWDTSGLTNPLKGASQSSAIIDVDFLSTNGVATSYTNPLQKDLAEFGLNTFTISGNTGQSSNIFDSIMSKASGSDGRKSPYKDSKVLSLDARNLLDQLPDLDYLQSNMLMFPMGSGTSTRLPQ